MLTFFNHSIVLSIILKKKPKKEIFSVPSNYSMSLSQDHKIVSTKFEKFYIQFPFLNLEKVNNYFSEQFVCSVKTVLIIEKKMNSNNANKMYRIEANELNGKI
ncbi:hypothetical protein BpHYR1_008516 [Brachionus plicatilis]|uniref:Uncharacterized protein n=1 Tax=Brachionus plicatilis TaxID=10195 RepID=A0A3M7T4K4_BRAPC|nr:hypothetical protein BpHYR1_008516 [Brachionus plicatilis]